MPVFFLLYNKIFLIMQNQTQKGLVIDAYGNAPQLKTDLQKPKPGDGDLLIKVDASTINPSDRLFMQGAYFKKPLPTVCGIQGTGVVVDANGENLAAWIGKRVSFTSFTGSWAEYALSKPSQTFQIDNEVPLSSAASGIVNPLTVVGMVQHSRELGSKGIIHTAAASALGRMLNKLCIKNKIPLLNIVRKQEQAEILRKEGAQRIINTSHENWQTQLKEYIKNEGFDCIYDALGGGPISQILVSSLGANGVYHLYGVLQKKPFVLNNPGILFSGMKVTGFLLFPWWHSTSKEIQERVRKEYSDLLKNELQTTTYKQLSISQIGQALQLSVSKANEGKVLLKIN